MISYFSRCSLFSALLMFLKILHFGRIHIANLAILSTLPVYAKNGGFVSCYFTFQEQKEIIDES